MPLFSLKTIDDGEQFIIYNHRGMYCTVLYEYVQYCTSMYCTVRVCTVLYEYVLYSKKRKQTDCILKTKTKLFFQKIAGKLFTSMDPSSSDDFLELA